MKKSEQQKSEVRKISLELNSHIQPRSTSFGQSRLSMSYSTKLKRRTQALYAQRAGLDHYLLKSQTCLQRQSAHNKPIQVYQRRIRQYKPITASKAIRNTKTASSIKSIQTIQVNAKSLIVKEKQINRRHQLQTEHKNDLAPNYGTISTLYIDNSSTLRDHKEEILLQTCPNFSQVQNNRSSDTNQCQNLLCRSVSEALQEKVKQKNKEIVSAEQISVNNKISPQSSQERTKNVTNKKQIKNGTRKNELTLNETYQQKNIHKQMYHTNNINLSQHFKNYDEKVSIFPTCRKMTISNVNRLYELCIEQIKNSDLQKKSQRKQQNTQADEKMERQIKNKIELMKSNLAQNAYQKYQRAQSASLPGKRYRNEKQQKNEKFRYEQTKNKIVSETNFNNVLSFTTANRNLRNEAEENRVWLQIKNCVDDEEQLGYSLCIKKQLVERTSCTQAQKKNMVGKSKKKCNTEVHRFEDQDGNRFVQINHPLTAVKVSKLRTTKVQISPENNRKQVEDSSLAAWDTFPHTVDPNENSNGVYNF